MSRTSCPRSKLIAGWQPALQQNEPKQLSRFEKKVCIFAIRKMIQSMSEMSTSMGSDLENLTKMNEDMDMDKDFDDDEDTDED